MGDFAPKLGSRPGRRIGQLAKSGVTPGSYTLSNITVDAFGRVTTASNGSAITSWNGAPGGRLSLSSSAAVQIADVSAATTVYYLPYIHDQLPVVGLALPSAGVSLSLNTGVQLSGKLYDLFLYNNSGTLILATGPAWTNSTTRSAAIDQTTVAGIWTNTSSMTLSFGSSTTTASAGTALYIGTMYASANGQCTCQFNTSGASGGSAPIVGLYNAYNRVPGSSVCLDTKANWTYASGTWRSADNSTSNRVSYVDGLGTSMAEGLYSVFLDTNSAAIGINLNSTSATPTATTAGLLSSLQITIISMFSPAMGFNFLQAMESALNATTPEFFGFAGAQFMSLIWKGEY